MPVNNAWYYDATYGHGPLALSAGQTLALNGIQERLHPSLSFLANRWNNRGDVAFIQGIGDGSANSFSHFDSMRMWQTADSALLTPSGWLGRFNDLRQAGNAYASMSLYDYRLESQGVQSAPVVAQRLSDFFVREPGFPLPDPAFWRTQLQASAQQIAPGLAELGQLITRTYGMSAEITAAANDALPYSESDRVPFYLAQAALLIKAGVASQTYSYAFGPFDTHGDQLTRQSELFNQLNAGLTAFFSVLAASPRANDVIVVISSEFGRQVTHNASAGTDHGLAGTAIAFGGGIRGGLYGELPTLDPGGVTRPNRINDALPITTNFRRLYAPILNKLAGDNGTAQLVLGSGFGADLGIFGAAESILRNGFEGKATASTSLHHALAS